MTPCKFQIDMHGRNILIYSEDRETVFAVAEGKHAKKLRKSLGLPKCLGKTFAMAEMTSDGQIILGDQLADQGW